MRGGGRQPDQQEQWSHHRDHQPDGIKITSSLSTFKVGAPYHFVVTNADTTTHELMVMPTAKGTASEDERDASELFGLSELDPGQSGTNDFTFTAAAPGGVLEMACHVPGHYASNMRLAITVQ